MPSIAQSVLCYGADFNLNVIIVNIKIRIIKICGHSYYSRTQYVYVFSQLRNANLVSIFPS